VKQDVVPVFFSLAYKLMLSHNVSFHINTCSNILLHKPKLAKNVPVFFSLAYMKQDVRTGIDVERYIM
jgi:hypothetical protein